MKYALIGCGRIAANHIKAVLNNKLELAAVCDTVPAHMEMLLKKYGLESKESIQRYTSYKQMLAEHPDLELAAIATESGLHARIALDCIDSGVNVIVEKPIALSMLDAEEIIRRSEAKGVQVCACHQNRFNIAVQKTKEAIEAGRFGKLSHGSVHVRWSRDKNYYDTNLEVWDFLDEVGTKQSDELMKEPASDVYGNGHTRLYADMINAVQQHQQPYVSAVAGRNALEMILAIYKSQKTGFPIKLPLGDFSSMDMLGEF